MSNKPNAELSTGMSALAGKYLTFALSEERYGVEILKVQEIIGVMHFTVIPKSPDYLKGVINLRGKVIPVVDLRLKFGMSSIPYNEKTCIIVVNAKLKNRQMLIGVVVDTVLEVMNFLGEHIQPAPEYGTGINSNFLLGMGHTHEGHIIILIDIEKALADAADVIPEQLPEEA